MKKLLICSPSHNIRGGVESIINDLCRELPKRGWEVLLALGEGSRFNRVLKYREIYPDLPIIEIDGTKGTRQSRVESLVKILKKIKPDIVFSARIFDAYHAVTLLKRRYQAPRLAIGIRAYEPQYFYDARMYKDNIDLCVTSGNLIAVASVSWSGLAEKRVINVPGGIHAPGYTVQVRKPGNKLRIGYVGRLEQYQKRIFDFVPFLKELDRIDLDYSIDIIGSGPEGKQLQEKIRHWIDTDKVRLYGWQSRNRLYDHFFPNMDCFVHFADFEGVTIAPREAMINGVVPVISQFTGLRTEGQFIHNFNSLTFPVGDINSAVANIKRLVVESDLMETLSANAIRSQKGKYTSDGSMDAWAKAFDCCMKMPLAIGKVPDLSLRSSGRLALPGLSPWLAQRLRNFIGKKHIHQNAGSEWPTHSGELTEEAALEIKLFAVEHEKKNFDP